MSTKQAAAKSSSGCSVKSKPTATKASSAPPTKSEEVIVFKFTDDSAEDLIKGLIPDVAESFGDSAWKVRLSGRTSVIWHEHCVT
jgi:hypothetical protein